MVPKSRRRHTPHLSATCKRCNTTPFLCSLPIMHKAPRLPVSNGSFFADLRIARDSLSVSLPWRVSHWSISHSIAGLAVDLQQPPPTTDGRPCPSIAPHVNPREVAKSVSVLVMVLLLTTQNLRCQAPRSKSQARKVGLAQRPRANDVRRTRKSKHYHIGR